MSTEAQQILHVAHTAHDEDWVQGVLVPALRLSDEQVWTWDEADPGSLKLEELERAVTSHRYTLLVVSSAARVDQWTQFAARLAEHLGVEEEKPRLLLAALDFEPGSARARELVPLGQRCLDCFDFSSPERTAAALARLAAQLQVATAPEPPRECPYPGLRMFGADGPGSFHRTDLFFGRDAEGRAIVERLRAGGRVLLVGPSGCGKSSLVRARVLPALTQGDGAMAYAIARPGTHPDTALRAALDALDPRLGPATDAYLDAADAQAARATLAEATAGPARLLFLDQFEEVFQDGAEATGGGERARSFARLAALCHVPGLALLLNMRADFYGDLMHSPAWDDFKDHRVELAPLRGAALRLAIARPAEAVGVYVEPDLVERLVREADQDRAAEALPLLQVALEQLWPLREWRYLSLASYERLADGERRGLDVVLARHADQAIAALPEPRQLLARRVLIDLVQLGEGRPDTRRRRTASELRRAGDDDRALAQVLDRLSQQRLIVIGAEASAPPAAPSATSPAAVTERHVDLAHDTLITGWPALTGWIAKRRDDLRTQRRLEARAAGGGLLARSELAEFTRWVAHVATPEGQAVGATDALLALVRRSLAARRTRRLTLVTGLVALIAVLAVAAAVSLWQRGIALDNAERATANAEEAVRQRAQADAERDTSKRLLVRSAQAHQETGRARLLAGRPFESIPYLVEAHRAGADNSPLRLLFAAATRHLPAMLFEHEKKVSSAAFSPDGTRVVTASQDWTARVWDAATGELVAPPLQHRGDVWSAAFSPDGKRIVTASGDRTARIWDAATGKPLAGPLQHRNHVHGAAFSPDGKLVVTASADGTAGVWDAATGEPRTSLRHSEHVRSAAFSPSGKLVITAGSDRTVYIWDASTGERHGTPFVSEGLLDRAAISPDGARVTIVSTNHSGEEQTVRGLDLSTGTPLATSLQHQQGERHLAISLDGRRVLTASFDGTARVRDAVDGSPVTLPFAPQAKVLSAAFSPDGARVVTVSEDKSVRVWNATTGAPLTPPLQHQDPVVSAAFSPDGARVLTTSEDQTARLWGASIDERPAAPLRYEGHVLDVAFTPRGPRVVASGGDGAWQVWDAGTGKPLSLPLRHEAGVWGVTLSPDDARVVLVSGDGVARILDAATGKLLAGPFPHEGEVSMAAFSSDGARVATASKAGTARVWDATSAAPLTPPLPHDGAVLTVAFSPDGARVVTASQDGTARVWSVATGQPISPPLQHRDAVQSAMFSSDGAQIVTASRDKYARVWEAATGKPLATPLEHEDAVTSAAFHPDGTLVVTTSNDTTRVWDATTGMPLAPPLSHSLAAEKVVFSPDGARVLTLIYGGTAHLQALSLDHVTPAAWSAAAARAPYFLEHGVLKLRAHRDASERRDQPIEPAR